MPLDWAATQNNLGNALLNLGERETGTARLEEAFTAFRLALEEFNTEGLSWHRNGAQAQLYLVLQMLLERRD